LTLATTLASTLAAATPTGALSSSSARPPAEASEAGKLPRIRDPTATSAPHPLPPSSDRKTELPLARPVQHLAHRAQKRRRGEGLLEKVDAWVQTTVGHNGIPDAARHEEHAGRDALIAEAWSHFHRARRNGVVASSAPTSDSSRSWSASSSSGPHSPPLSCSPSLCACTCAWRGGKRRPCRPS